MNIFPPPPVLVASGITPSCGTNGAFIVTSNRTCTYNVSGPVTLTFPSGKSFVATGLPPGSYTVVATPATGCGSTTTVVVPTIPMMITATSTGTSCGFPNGTATVAPSGGTGSYTYLWSNSATTASITGLDAGNYMVTATNASGCTATASTVVAPSTGAIVGAL